MKTKSLLAAFCIAACAMGNTLEVANDTAQSLSDWMAAQDPAIVDLTEYDEIHFKGTANLTLASELAGWPGVVRIKEGALVTFNKADSLGTSAGETYVENGGTLAADMTGIGADALSIGNEVLYFEGTGVDGNGALQAKNLSLEQESIFGKNYHLTGDALIRIPSKRHDFSNFTFYLNGHTLSIRGDNNCLNGGRFKAGHVKMVSGNFIMQNTLYFEGGYTNTLEFGNGRYQYWGMTSSSQTPWTLIFNTTDACQAGNYGGTGTANIWEGPVQIKKNISLTCYTSGSGHRFKGYVYGSGKITVSGNANTSGSYSSRINLFLDCPTNSFTGGVDLNYSTLHLSTNGALPAAGGDLHVTGGTVDLTGLGTYDLPAAVFSSTGMVMNGIGSWRSLTKDGAGELVYRSRVGAPLLDVQSGTFSIDGDMNSGVWEGMLAGSDSGYDSAWNAGTVISNTMAQYPAYCYRTTSNGWKDYMYVTYSGYIWNHSDEPVTWTFACCFDDRAKMFVNGTKVFETTAWQWPFFGQVTLQPGPNPFKWMGINWTGGGGGTAGRDEGNGNVATWVLAKALSYHIGATDSKDPADYIAFAPGDGLLTLTDGSDDVIDSVHPQFEKVKLAAGVTLGTGTGDACLPVDELEGLSAAVTGSGLKIGEKWTLPAADVNTNGTLAVSGTLAFADGAVVAADPAALAKVPASSPYTIARAASVSGKPGVDPALDAAHWRVRVEGTDVKLFYASGVIISFR